MSFHGTSDIFREDFAWLWKTANLQFPFDCYESLVGKNDERTRNKEKRKRANIKNKEKCLLYVVLFPRSSSFFGSLEKDLLAIPSKSPNRTICNTFC